MLAVAALGWSVLWLFIRSGTADAIDGWAAAEAAVGRRWSCADRSIGGYPFRIEVRCREVRVERPDATASLGPLLVVAQVYRPRHLIAETLGPFRVVAGDRTADGNWQLLRASIVTRPGGVERVAAVIERPRVRIDGGEEGALDLASASFEGHLRPSPATADAWDVALSSRGATVPGLDALLGGREFADVDLALTVTQAADLPARPLVRELERWRNAGGEVLLARVALTKGGRRVAGTGKVGIDAAHRPEGQLDLAVAGIEGLLGRVVGDRGLLGSRLLGSLLGGAPAAAPAAAASAGLKPLPPLRLDSGRLFLGPLPIPGLALPVLY